MALFDINDFMRISEREILTHAGKINSEAAMEHAQEEFDKYKQRHLEEKSKAEKDFEMSLNQLEKIVSSNKDQ